MIFDDNRLRLYQILRGDALIVDYTADSLGKHVSNAELLHLMATLGVRDRVCEHDLLKCRILDALTGRTTHDAMRSTSSYAQCTMLHHQVSSLSNGASCVNHVIDKYYVSRHR